MPEPTRLQAVALHDMLEALFGARTMFRENPENVSMGLTALRVLSSNPMRVGFVAYNLSGNGVYLAPSNLVSSSRGIYLAPNGGGVSLVWDRDFELCSAEWWGIATAAASTIYVLELINS